MLPLIVDEEKVFIFKFWLNGNIQAGMCYRGELFCRLCTVEIEYRPQVYHLGCKLTQPDITIVLTSAITTCSLWASLRNPQIEILLQKAEAFNLPQSSLLHPLDAPGALEDH